MYLDEIRKDEDTEKTFFLTLENIIKIPVDKKTTQTKIRYSLPLKRVVALFTLLRYYSYDKD